MIAEIELKSITAIVVATIAEKKDRSDQPLSRDRRDNEIDFYLN